LTYKYEINADFENRKDTIVNIKSYFNNSLTTIHKARNEIKIIKFQSQELVVKSFKVPNFINQIAYSFFRASKAKKSYTYALKIKNFTPQPIGYIEFYKYGLLKNSYFVSEKFDYDFTIREPFLDKNFPDRDEIFKAFANFTLELHNSSIFHNDYSPGNILIKKEKQNFIFKIVDINRMKFTTLDETQRAKNFSKLWASDDILTLIAKEYMKGYSTTSDFINKVLYFSNKNKKIKNFKKRLKGQEVND
jgi:serine/threonine protein kinase